ncbi:hypothetical protein [Geopseudomonas aromaticivorans]
MPRSYPEVSFSSNSRLTLFFADQGDLYFFQQDDSRCYAKSHKQHPCPPQNFAHDRINHPILFAFFLFATLLFRERRSARSSILSSSLRNSQNENGVGQSQVAGAGAVFQDKKRVSQEQPPCAGRVFLDEKRSGQIRAVSAGAVFQDEKRVSQEQPACAGRVFQDEKRSGQLRAAGAGAVFQDEKRVSQEQPAGAGAVFQNEKRGQPAPGRQRRRGFSE